MLKKKRTQKKTLPTSIKIISITEIRWNLLRKPRRVFWKYPAFVNYPYIVYEEGV